MHFEKLTDPNPRFRLFGAPESRFLSAFGQGKGALGIPKPWIRCSLIRAKKWFYGSPTSARPCKKTLYTMMQRVTLTPY